MSTFILPLFEHDVPASASDMEFLFEFVRLELIQVRRSGKRISPGRFEKDGWEIDHVSRYEFDTLFAMLPEFVKESIEYIFVPDVADWFLATGISIPPITRRYENSRFNYLIHFDTAEHRAMFVLRWF